MHWGWGIAGAAAGALAGARLHPVVLRHATPRLSGLPLPPATEPPASAARRPAAARPRAATGAPGPAAGSPARAGAARAARVPPASALAVVAGVLLALVAGRYGARPETVAVGWVAVVGVALAAVDVAAHRLPDRLVLPAYPVVLGALAVAATADASPGRLARAVAAGVLLAAAYLALALARPGDLGLGDVKLAGVLGLVLGWAGWPAFLVGALGAHVLLGAIALVLLALRRVTLRSALPFGPFMLAAALLALLAA